MPAAKKQCYDDRRATDHCRVFAKKKERKFHRRIFSVITAGQFLLSFRQIEWQSVGLGENRYRKNDKRDDHRNREQPFPEVHPIADEGRDHPAVFDLIANDTR